MTAPRHMFIEIREGDVDGLRKSWKIVRLLVDADENGIPEREIGYDKKGQLIHRWPGSQSLTERGILDLAVFDRSRGGEIGESEFERLWDEAIEDEKFFAEADPYGDRFGTSLPKWGCLAVLALLCGLSVLVYRMIS